MEQSFKKGTVLHLASLIEYSEGGVISKQLIKSPAGNITLFSFDKGEEISTHASSGDAMVTVLEGKGKFTISGEEFVLEAGQTIIMPKDEPHSVYGEDKFKMLLVVSF